MLNLVVLNFSLDVLNFCCLEFGCLEPLLFLHLLNLSMIFRSTELLFFYFEASFLLICMSSRILELFFFYFEASFLLSYLSSRILMYFVFELFSFYFEASFLLSYLSSCFNVSWFSRILGFCLLNSSNIAFSLINFF